MLGIVGGGVIGGCIGYLIAPFVASFLSASFSIPTGLALMETTTGATVLVVTSSVIITGAQVATLTGIIVMAMVMKRLVEQSGVRIKHNPNQLTVPSSVISIEPLAFGYCTI